MHHVEWLDQGQAIQGGLHLVVAGRQPRQQMRRVRLHGGSSGIGWGIAQAFAAAGDQVVATGATPTEVQAAIARQAADGHGAIELQAMDVRSEADVSASIGRLDRLDVLVNCAGVIRRGEEHDPAVFAAVLDINLNGTMRACAAARPLLKARAGCIVNTASMLSFFGGGLVPAYSASKGGVAQARPSRWRSPMRPTAFASTPSRRGGSPRR